MVDTITYRIRRADGSCVEEFIDLPPSVATAVAALMRMHGGVSATPVDIDFATHVANGPPGRPRAVVPASQALRPAGHRQTVAASMTRFGFALLFGVLLARAVRSPAEQPF